jgi:hypothetical protein
MNADYIKRCIEETVHADYSGTLHDVDVVAMQLAAYIKGLEDRIAELERKPVEPWEDRMGGQFTQEEINRGDTW